MSRYNKTLVVIVFVGFVPSLLEAAQFAPIPTLPGTTEMRAMGVSSDGNAIVGQVHAGSASRAFLWHAADPMPLVLDDLPGGITENESTAISADGSVVVGRGESPLGSEALLWPAVGPPTGLGDLPEGFNSSRATSVSANGAVAVGTGHSMMGREAFRWSDGVMEGLGYLPNGVASEALDTSQDGAVVVGVSETFNAILGEAFRWTADGGMVALGDLPGGDFMSRANAVSSVGTTVVGVSSSSLGSEAFRWTSGSGMEALGDLAGGVVASTAYDVSANGNRIVGAGMTDNANTTAFLWTAELGMRSLADVLITDHGLDSELDGWNLLAARSISSDGSVIVGTGINPSGQVRGWWAELDDVQVLAAGDINEDGQLDIDDMESLQTAIRMGDQAVQFDLNGDGTVDAGDQAYWVHDLKNTYIGDANLDGQFNSGDLVAIFGAAQYEDDIPGNSNWKSGDWNGDLEFTSDDIILAFQDGGYERGVRAAVQSVPEPVFGSLTIVALMGVLVFDRARKIAPYRCEPQKMGH